MDADQDDVVRRGAPISHQSGSSPCSRRGQRVRRLLPLAAGRSAELPQLGRDRCSDGSGHPGRTRRRRRRQAGRSRRVRARAAPAAASGDRRRSAHGRPVDQPCRRAILRVSGPDHQLDATTAPIAESSAQEDGNHRRFFATDEHRGASWAGARRVRKTRRITRTAHRAGVAHGAGVDDGATVETVGDHQAGDSVACDAGRPGLRHWHPSCAGDNLGGRPPLALDGAPPVADRGPSASSKITFPSECQVIHRSGDGRAQDDDQSVPAGLLGALYQPW